MKDNLSLDCSSLFLSSLPIFLPPHCCLSLFTVFMSVPQVLISIWSPILSFILCPALGSVGFISGPREIHFFTLNQNADGLESSNSSKDCICGCECYWTYIRSLVTHCKIHTMWNNWENRWRSILSPVLKQGLKNFVGDRHVNNLLAEAMTEVFIG